MSYYMPTLLQTSVGLSGDMARLLTACECDLGNWANLSKSANEHITDNLMQAPPSPTSSPLPSQRQQSSASAAAS